MTWRLYASAYDVATAGEWIIDVEYTADNTPYISHLKHRQADGDSFFACPRCGRPARSLLVTVRGLCCEPCSRRAGRNQLVSEKKGAIS